MSDLDKAATVLVNARIMLHKFMIVADRRTGRSNTVLASFGEQLRCLQVTLAKAQNSQKSLESRVKELERREKEVKVAEEALQKRQDEVVLKYEMVVDGEKALSKKLEQVELLQEEVKKWLRLMALEKKSRDSEKEKQTVLVKERYKREEERIQENRKRKLEENKNAERLEEELRQQVPERGSEDKLESVGKFDTDVVTGSSRGNAVNIEEETEKEERNKSCGEAKANNDNISKTISSVVENEAAEEGRKRRKTVVETELAMEEQSSDKATT